MNNLAGTRSEFRGDAYPTLACATHYSTLVLVRSHNRTLVGFVKWSAKTTASVRCERGRKKGWTLTLMSASLTKFKVDQIKVRWILRLALARFASPTPCCCMSPSHNRPIQSIRRQHRTGLTAESFLFSCRWSCERVKWVNEWAHARGMNGIP